MIGQGLPELTPVEIVGYEVSEAGSPQALDYGQFTVEDNKVYFNEKTVFVVNPMIGVIGVAPKEGSVNCGTPGNHGGNMDNKRIAKGATLYFPVFHNGAIFSLGDVHAAMGDGEVMVSGVEISADVTVRLSVIKGVSIETPMLENDDICGVIYSDENIEQAVFYAVKIMNDIVQEKLELSFNDAGMLLSAVGDLKFCQVVDPKRTVMMCIPKTILSKLFQTNFRKTIIHLAWVYYGNIQG